MPLYFFDMIARETHLRDEKGMEFSDREEARDHAIDMVHTLARRRGRISDRALFACSIRAETGQTIYTATFMFVGRWG